MSAETDQYWRYYINVCFGDQCTKNGAQKVFGELKKGLEDIPKAYVNTSVCSGACRWGPNVEFTRQTRPMEKQERLDRFYSVGWWRIFGGTRIKDVIAKVKHGIPVYTPDGSE